MNTYFCDKWFYEKFTLPACDIHVDDREYSVTVDFTATKEDLEIGKIPMEEVSLVFCVAMPKIDPCALIGGVKEEEDPLDETASFAALVALKRIIRERHGCGLAAYWYENVDRDDPGFRPLTEKENEKIQEFISHNLSNGPLCKNAPDALYTIEHMCKLIVDEIDKSGDADPLLFDHLECFTELRRKILCNGLPTIADENMFYEIVMNGEAVFVQLCHVRIEYALHKLLNLYDKESEDHNSVIIPWRTVLYSVPFPILSCTEFAKRCGVNQGTVRQWIRRGKLRSAFKSGRDWMIPATTKPPGRGFTPGRYRLTDSVPVNAITQYPFLKQFFRHDLLLIYRFANGKYIVMKGQRKERAFSATLSQSEREKFEYFLLEADWIKHDLGQKTLRTMIHPNQNNKEAIGRMDFVDMNMLQRMEEKNHLNEVAKRTQSGELKWECVEYNPLCLMSGDRLDEKPYLSHAFELETQINGIPYSLEITESIDVPDGMGNIYGALERKIPGDFMRIDFSMRFDEKYDDCRPENLKEAFQDDATVMLSDSLIPQIAASECVASSYEWSRFFYEGEIPTKLHRHPLVKLSESLYNQGRILDFHYCILDTEYRKKLLAELK